MTNLETGLSRKKNIGCFYYKKNRHYMKECRILKRKQVEKKCKAKEKDDEELQQLWQFMMIRFCSVMMVK